MDKQNLRMINKNRLRWWIKRMRTDNYYPMIQSEADGETKGRGQIIGSSVVRMKQVKEYRY